MDELQKKRESIADPNKRIESIGDQDYLKLSEKEIASIKSDFLFENQLEQSLNIDVPEELADRILLKQRAETPSLLNRMKPMLSVAASISLVITLFVMTRSPELSKVALDHVYHELDHLVDNDEKIDRQLLAQQIEHLGFKLEQLPKTLSYAGRCKLDGKEGIHLVAQVNNRPVTLLMSASSPDQAGRFEDGRFEGLILKNGNVSLIYIGETIEDVEALLKQTQSS